MSTRQVTYPNINVSAIRGYCLKYVDDGVNAPSRQPTATAAFNVENRNGNIRTGDLPVGVWVPIFFDITSGVYKGLGHVAWAINYGNRVEIHDSETGAHARAPYGSIQEVINWFGKSNTLVYKGYSLWVDGAHIAEEVADPVSPANPQLVAAKGTATVLVDALNVRNEPSKDSAVQAVYGKGQTFNYDGYITANGYLWLSYISNSGVRRYIAEGPDDGNDSTVYVSGGV